MTTAQLFEIDNVKRFEKLWESCSEDDRAIIADIVTSINGERSGRRFTDKELSRQAEEVIVFLNEKTQKRFRCVEAHMKHIRARLKSGITVQELKAIIAKKQRDWSGTDMEAYMRPATLFCESNCENYLGEIG